MNVARTAVIIGWVNAIVVAVDSGISQTAKNMPIALVLMAMPRTHCNLSRGSAMAARPSCRHNRNASSTVPTR